ncbi:MAG: hypothetical protein OEV93_02270 [Candidatus Moranbacteria bacterium]|nr:hypothetical protein [Candidatus Moranbacteria bacterium]
MNESQNKEKKEIKIKKKWIFLFLVFLLLGLFLLNKFFGIGNILRGGISEKLHERNGAEIIEIKKKETEKKASITEEETLDTEKGIETKTVDETEVIETEEDADVELDVTIKKSETLRKEEEMEGYSVHQISFGNSVVVNNNEIAGVDLKINSIKSEVMESLSGEGVNAMITWVTTKSSISELVYSKKDGGGRGSVSEKSYGISHAVFVEGLDEDEDYVFNIKVKSKNNEIVESGFISFRTELENVFVSTVKNAFRSLFGF